MSMRTSAGRFGKSCTTLAAAWILALTGAGMAAWATDAGSPLPHWSYEGDDGAEHWHALSSAFEACGKGHMQSPINIEDVIEAPSPPLMINYATEQASVVNNGHSVQVDLAGDSAITLNGEKYTLLQFHFHVPSENHIKGKEFPAELHLVHRADNGALAVIAVMITTGAPNLSLANVIDKAPAKPSAHGVPIAGGFDAADVLPDDLRYYAFEGSLTTPPCSEGVGWRVLETSISLSPEQIERLRQIMPRHNARPVQAQGSRLVIESAGAAQHRNAGR